LTRHSYAKHDIGLLGRYIALPWLKALVAATRQGAKTKGVAFTLDVNEVAEVLQKQRGRCAITGRNFNKERNSNSYTRPDGATIDRIDPHGTYCKENVRIVTFQANAALNDWGDNVLVSFCRDVLHHRETMNEVERLEQNLACLDKAVVGVEMLRDREVRYGPEWDSANLKLFDLARERAKLARKIEEFFEEVSAT
jgi:hypothetical protein